MDSGEHDIDTSASSETTNNAVGCVVQSLRVLSLTDELDIFASRPLRIPVRGTLAMNLSRLCVLSSWVWQAFLVSPENGRRLNLNLKSK